MGEDCTYLDLFSLVFFDDLREGRGVALVLEILRRSLGEWELTPHFFTLVLDHAVKFVQRGESRRSVGRPWRLGHRLELYGLILAGCPQRRHWVRLGWLCGERALGLLA